VAKAKNAKTARKSASRSRAASRKPKSSEGDSSRLDTKPLQEHIRKRIKELEGQRPSGARSARRQEDDGTLERLRQALETIEDICHPSMMIPI
jgi:hypothetical protein